MLRARLATAAVAIPLLLAIIFVAPTWWWGALVVVIASLAIVEYLRLAFGDRLGPRVVGGALGLAVVLAAVSAPVPGLWLTASLAAILPDAMTYVVLLRKDLAEGLTDIGAIAVGVLYGGLLLPHFYWLRHLPEGSAWVTFVIAIGMAGDTGGYFVGRAYGRTSCAAPQPRGEGRSHRRLQPARRRHCCLILFRSTDGKSPCSGHSCRSSARSATSANR